MIVKVTKPDKIVLISAKKISHYEITPAWNSGAPTLHAIKENQEATPICERKTVDECMNELAQINRAEELESNEKVKDLIISIDYFHTEPPKEVKEPKEPNKK